MTPHPFPAPSPSWTGVEHRHLASLAAVAQARSFRGAARELGYSQSALSQHVAQLERLLDVRLAERRRGSSEVTLTAAGEALLRHVGPILAIYRAAQADLEALAADGAGGGGLLRLGLAEHLATELPSAVLPAFLQQHPGVEVELERGADPAALAAALEAGELDAVVGDPPGAPGALEMTLLAPEPYMLVAPAAWGVVRRAATTVDELLEHLPIAVNDGDPDAARLLRELRAAGLVPAPAAHAPSLAALLAQVAAGVAAALVPAGAVAAGPRVVVRPLDGLVGARPVAVLWQGARRRAPLVDAFVAAVVRTRGRAVAGQRRAAQAA